MAFYETSSKDSLNIDEPFIFLAREINVARQAFEKVYEEELNWAKSESLRDSLCSHCGIL